MISKQNEVMGVLEDSGEIEEPSQNMEQMPTNLSMNKLVAGSDDFLEGVEMKTVISATENLKNSQTALKSLLTESSSAIETKIQLSFSVDRLLSCAARDNVSDPQEKPPPDRVEKCCESVFACCAYPSCLVGSQHEIHHRQQLHLKTFQSAGSSLHGDSLGKLYQSANTTSSNATPTYLDFTSVVRPTPIRAIGTNCDPAQLCASFPAMATSSLLRFHHQQQQQQKVSSTHPHATSLALSPLMAPLRGLKSLQHSHATQHFPQAATNRFQAKASHNLADIPANLANNHHQQQQHQQQLATTGSGSVSGNTSGGKRKRSWSRAVFSNLQRKGLEIQFQQQKYITKPDRRKLAARLNLTDAQVKVWFQNRRMKWRHTRENLKSGQEKQIPTATPEEASSSIPGNNKPHEAIATEEPEREMGYSTDGSSSVEMSENDDEDGDDEIDVVE